MARPRLDRVADEAAALGLGDQLPHRVLVGRRVELDLEARLDVDERIQPVAVAPRDRAVRSSLAHHIQAGFAGGVVHARERAANESCEHEMFRPPLVLTLEGAATQRAPRGAAAIDADLELENSRLDGHGRSLPGVIRALA